MAKPTTKTIDANCTKCGRTQKIRVSRDWWNTDRFSCCGRSRAFWLAADGTVKVDG